MATFNGLLDINTLSYTGALITLDTGVINSTTQMPRAIGQPLLKLGKTSYSTTPGDYYGIGLGYSPSSTSYTCCEVGCIITNKSNNEYGDLLFSTRPNTSNTPATERMRIRSDGNVGIGTTTPNATLHVSGTTLLNNTTINSSLNVSGFTTLNNITILSTLNVSGFTTLNNNTTVLSSFTCPD